MVHGPHDTEGCSETFAKERPTRYAVPMDRSKESHHFVPQFYLRQWCDRDGYLWVVPTASDRKPFKSTPKAVAAANGLYDSAGTPFADFDYEGELAKIEGLYARIWPDVFDGIGDPQTKEHLSRFLALMLVRNPRQKDRLAKLNHLCGMIASEATGPEVLFIDAAGSRSTIKVSELQRAATNSDQVLHEGFLNVLRGTLKTHAEAIAGRRWGVIVADQPIFVTSDNPVVLRRGECTLPAYGLRTPGTEITFPISPTRLLVISDTFKEDGLHYPLLKMGDWNAVRMESADRFVFSWDHLAPFPTGMPSAAP